MPTANAPAAERSAKQLAARFRNEGPLAHYRHPTLYHIAGRLRWEGHDQVTITEVLRIVNQNICVPPVLARDIERMGKSICKHSPGPGRSSVTRETFDRCRTRIDELRQVAASLPWTGRGASTDVTVLAALHQVGYRTGRLQFGASFRELAELAGVSFVSARRACIRLVRAGWVCRVDPGGVDVEHYAQPGLPTFWRLRKPRNVAFCNIHTPSGFENVTLCNNSADLWRRGGALGLTAHRIWFVLDTVTPHRAAEIARRLGCHRSTVGVNLRRLERYALAQRQQGRWTRTGAIPPESYLRLERQRETHASDRARFADAVMLKRRKASKMQIEIPPAARWLLVTMAAPDAIKLAAFLIVFQTKKPTRLVTLESYAVRESEEALAQ